MGTKATGLPASGASWTDRLVIGQSDVIKRADLLALKNLIKPGMSRVPPSNSALPTWINQDGATVTDIDGYGFTLNKDATVAASSMTCRVRDVPVGNWTATFGLRRGVPFWKYRACGIVVASQNVGTSAWKLMTLTSSYYSDAAFLVQQWSAVNTFQDSYNKVRYSAGNQPFFMRVSWNGTTYQFDMSLDGVVWHFFHKFNARSDSVLNNGQSQANDKVGVYILTEKQSSGQPNTSDQLGVAHFTIA